jgi:hypothetical protein
MTRNAARRACTSQTGNTSLRQNPPNPETPKTLYALIQSTQESDPLCRRVDKELRLRDLNQMQCPPRQRETVATRAHWSSTWVEGSRLLCRADRVHVPPPEAIRHELLKLFHADPFRGTLESSKDS